MMRNRFTYAVLASAAVLLILFTIPLQFHKNLVDIYNFDDAVPLNYHLSSFRNTKQANPENLASFRELDYKFKSGISEYLVMNYSAALKEWQDIEIGLDNLKNSNYYDRDYAENILLLKAAAQLALALSEKNLLNHTEKEELLNNTLFLFKKMEIDSGAEKYFYSLNLALTGNEKEAIEILTTMDSKSEFYNKGLALIEQLNSMYY